MSRYKEFDEYEELIKERLSKKRFTHSMNVAEACYDLSLIHISEPTRH